MQEPRGESAVSVGILRAVVVGWIAWSAWTSASHETCRGQSEATTARPRHAVANTVSPPVGMQNHAERSSGARPTVARQGLVTHPAIAASQYHAPRYAIPHPPVAGNGTPPNVVSSTPGRGETGRPRFNPAPGGRGVRTAGRDSAQGGAAARPRVVKVDAASPGASLPVAEAASHHAPGRSSSEAIITSTPRDSEVSIGAGLPQVPKTTPGRTPLAAITVYDDDQWPRDVRPEYRNPSPQVLQKIGDLIVDVQDPEAFLELDPRRSKLIRTRLPVSQFSITHPEILDVVQYSPTEFELIGGREGQTTLTLWFGDSVLRYLIRVARDKSEEIVREIEYGHLQRKMAEMFPNSMVQLIPFADKLIVRGQAKDAREAAQILAILGAQRVDQTGEMLGPGSFLNVGTAARPYFSADDLPSSNIINLLDVPHEQQIMLKVRVAELSRSAVREIGSNLNVTHGDFSFNAPFGIGNNVFQAILNSTEVYYAFQAVSSNSYSKVLAEPNLVTLNGQSASFIAGGEFAVPTFVGVGNETGLSTTFRGFGTQLSFTPTIIGKDLIRLVVSPSFTQPNDDYAVGDIPGLDSRAVTTTVNLREGQWLAIAGLIQDEQSGSKLRAPLLGDIPILDIIFSKKKVTRGETELVVLVSPEIIRPLEPEQAPLILPGMEVTEPTDCDFFLFGYYEGRPQCDHRSTVWPLQQQRVVEGYRGDVRRVKRKTQFQRSEAFYTYGRIGFSQ